MGPYATGAILSAMGVAQRYNKVLVHHTLRHPVAGQVRHAVPGLVAGLGPANTVPNTLFDVLAESAEAAQDHRHRHQQVPLDPLHVDGRARGGQEARPEGGAVPRVGLRQPRLRPDRRRVKDAKPDLVWIGDIGLEGNLLLDAMKKIDYTPPLHFHMYPAPGPMITLPEATGRAVAHDLRGASALHPRARRRGVRQGLQRARQGGQPAGHLGRGAGRRLVHGLADPGGGRARHQQPRRQEDRRLAEEEQGRHHPGPLRFDGPCNYGDDLMKIKQVQNGTWKVVYPPEFAAPGAKMIAR